MTEQRECVSVAEGERDPRMVEEMVLLMQLPQLADDLLCCVPLFAHIPPLLTQDNNPANYFLDHAQGVRSTSVSVIFMDDATT